MNRELLTRYIESAKRLKLTGMRIITPDAELEFDLAKSGRRSMPTNPDPAPAKTLVDVTSVFVGYFRPVVSVPSHVSKGDVVASVESLGLPNEIVAPVTGELLQFTVQDGEAVQYGTKLASIST
jgi:biotin carboxyl carrier protein